MIRQAKFAHRVLRLDGHDETTVSSVICKVLQNISLIGHVPLAACGLQNERKRGKEPPTLTRAAVHNAGQARSL